MLAFYPEDESETDSLYGNGPARGDSLRRGVTRVPLADDDDAFVRRAGPRSSDLLPPLFDNGSQHRGLLRGSDDEERRFEEQSALVSRQRRDPRLLRDTEVDDESYGRHGRELLKPLIEEEEETPDVQGRDRPRGRLERRFDYPGHEDKVATLQGNKWRHELADVIQDRREAEDFARQGRYGAAAAVSGAKFALGMGQYAAGASGQALIPVPVVGYQAGVAAYRGALGAAGEMVRAPAVKYERSDEGRIAAAKQRAEEYNEQIDAEGNFVPTDAQRRAEALGVRFREQGDDRVVERTAAGTAKGFVSKNFRTAGSILGAIFNKENWGSVGRWSKKWIAKFGKLFGRYNVARPEGAPPALSRGTWNTVKRALPGWMGGTTATAAPAREHLDRQRKALEGLNAAGGESMLAVQAGEGPAAQANPEDVARAELEARRDAVNRDPEDKFHESAPLTIDRANAHERQKVLDQAKTESATWRGPYDRMKDKGDAQTAHIPSMEEHRAMSSVERAETVALEHELLQKSGKLKGGLAKWRQRQHVLGLPVNQAAVARDLAPRDDLETRIQQRQRAIDFTTDAEEYQAKKREMEDLAGPDEEPFGYGITFGSNNLLSRLQGHVDALQPRTDADAVPDDDATGGPGARWKGLAAGIPLERPFAHVGAKEQSEGSESDTEGSKSDDEGSEEHEPGTALGLVGGGMQVAGDMAVKSRLLRHAPKVTRALGLAGTAVGGAADVGANAVASGISYADQLSGTPLVPVLGTAGQALAAAGGLLKTGQAYLNRDVDPETTAPLALAANRSAGDAFKGRQELAARARGKVLRRPGEIDPYVKRLFQAMGHKVINNRRLEMAQTEAGVTTADEKSMLETANLNLDPTRIEEFAAETDPRKLEQDPRRYALAKEELAVRGLIAQPGHAGGQQDPGNGQPSAVEDDGDSLPRFSGLLEESREQSGAGSDHSQALSEQADADSERSSGGGRILNVGQNVAFDDFMHYMAQSEAVASEQQPGRGAGSEQQQVLEQPVAGQPVIGGRAEEVPEAPVDELAVDGAQQAAVQPEEMQALQPPVVGRVDRNVEDQDDDDEVIRVNDDDDEVVRVDNDDDFEVERLGADDDDDIADDDVSRESIVNHRVGVPNIHRSEDDSDSDSELGSSLHGPQRRWASDDDSDVASEVDPNEMRLMDDDDDVVSVDGHIIKDSRRRQSV